MTSPPRGSTPPPLTIRSRRIGPTRRCIRLVGRASIAVASIALATSWSSGGRSVMAAAGEPIQALISARLADTRLQETTVDGQYAAIGRRPAKTATPIKVAGRGGVPADASAAMINVTSVQPAAPTFLTAYPCDVAPPNASNVNSPAFVDRANSAFVKLSAAGTVCIFNEAPGDFVIDVNGYVPAAGTPIALAPARLLDTRPGQPTVDGRHSGLGRPAPKSETVIQIAGRGGVPMGATAAMFNLTAEFPSAATYLTAYPCGNTKPEEVSNLNLPAGDTRANNVFVKLSTAGTVCIYTVAPTNIVIDISGYVPADGSPSSVNPARLADSRSGQKTVDGQFLGFGRSGAKSETKVQVAGRGDVPADATSALINLTADNPAGGTYLTAYPCDRSRPEPGSNLNLPPGDTGANSIFVKLSATGTVCIYTVAPTDIIIDVNGYIAAPKPSVCVNNGTITLPECQALVALYEHNNGINWIDQDGWMTASDPCTWDGVECYAGRVVELDLGGNNLSGAIPPQIGNFTELDSLDLSFNALASIPVEVSNIKGLTTLDLYGNKLTELPNHLGRLTDLVFLDLGDNSLSGDVTALFTPLRAAYNLVDLGLEGNKCLTTTSPTLATWLRGLDESWNDGC